MSQQERRQTPTAWSWEIPTAVTLAAVVVLALGAQLGRSLAVLASGQGWVWPRPSRLLGSVPGVFGGDATAGIEHSLAGVPALAGWVLTVEAGVLVLLVWVTGWAIRSYGPGRLQGMASAAEAERLLGRSRLWRTRRVIRPDLYGHATPTLFPVRLRRLQSLPTSPSHSERARR